MFLKSEDYRVGKMVKCVVMENESERGVKNGEYL